QPAPPSPTEDSPAQTRQGVEAPAKPDSVELLRKRTGTPRLGVPVTAGPVPPTEDPSQAPVAGVITTSSSVPARSKRASGGDSQNISQVWYEDEEDGAGLSGRARKAGSPSVTDLSLDEVPRRRRWPLLLGALAVLLAGGALAMTLAGGGASTKRQEQPPAAPPVAAAAAPPSTIIDSPDAGAEAAPPSAPATSGAGAAPAPASAHVAAKPDRRTEAAPPPSSPSRRNDDLTYIPPPDTGFRRPGGDTTSPPPPPPPKDPGPKGVSGSDLPQDPYGNPEVAPTGPAGGPEKQAEFFASLGAQQLGAGDTANAAANFKKALELDPKSAAATIGMGEIALRQGLFGDAIAHLQKAARLAPRNARVLVLTGEAYLALGRNQEAATSFKKALQLDPDNARARDGYNEASSRVPPPTDDK